MAMSAHQGLSARGFYELRDSTCEKCGVRFKREHSRLVFFLLTHLFKKRVNKLYCPICGGNVGRLKQTGVLKPKEKKEVEYDDGTL